MRGLRQKGRITNKQMSVLEAFVAESRDAGPIAKRVLIWALRKTASLTRPVHVLIPKRDPAWEDLFSAGGFKQINRMCGFSGNTRLSYFLDGMNSKLCISAWGDDKVHHLAISSKSFDKKLPTTTPARGEVESISVRHPYGSCDAKGEPYITIK
ncbi:MAG: hypothetical protein AAB792_01025 [Patescibacteria group bacterium]